MGAEKWETEMWETGAKRKRRNDGDVVKIRETVRREQS